MTLVLLRCIFISENGRWRGGNVSSLLRVLLVLVLAGVGTLDGGEPGGKVDSGAKCVDFTV
jgi:hypothetical protein